MAATLRTPKGEQKYSEYRKNLPAGSVCALCREEPLQSFNHWKIISNNFPYDKIAKTHHMIVPLRHVQENELNEEELAELLEIKSGLLNENYEYILEATRRQKSIPGHFHLHLIVLKS